MKLRADKSLVRHLKIATNGVKYGFTQVNAVSSSLFPTVTFRLKLTPELEKIAEKVDKTADGTQEYVFYASMLIVYQEDGDETLHLIELKEGAKEALYERLDEQCRKKLDKSCEKLLKEAKKRIEVPDQEIPDQNDNEDNE